MERQVGGTISTQLKYFVISILPTAVAGCPPGCFSYLGWGFQQCTSEECVSKNISEPKTLQLMEISHWCVFTSPTEEHKGPSLPHLGAYEHIAVMLMPIYRQKQAGRRAFGGT